MILYSKVLVEKLDKAIVRKVKKMQRKPTLAIVLIGNDPASLSYIRQKTRKAEKLGCNCEIFRIMRTKKEIDIIGLIKKLNRTKYISGIIVQLPLPKKFDTEKVIYAINQKKDIDNLRGDSPFLSPSTQAMWHMLSQASKLQKRAHILIVGYGHIIGKPFHVFLVQKGFTNIDIADKNTENLAEHIKKADVIISGVGKANLIKNVKKGALVIDAGASLYKGKMVGDVTIDTVKKQAKLVTPVPGGIGPLTVTYLFKNLVSTVK